MQRACVAGMNRICRLLLQASQLKQCIEVVRIAGGGKMLVWKFVASAQASNHKFALDGHQTEDGL